MRSRTQEWRRIALTCAASLVTASATTASAAPEGEGGAGNQRLAPDLAEPVLLKVGDKPIDAEEIGHAAPYFGDFDGDKIPDLLVGQFKDGLLAVYRNEGTAKAPVFKNRTWFKAGADLGKVPTGWCVGFGPQLADLNGDGINDVLSGSWPGELFLFLGQPGGEFAPPAKLKYKDGKTINIGGGLREDAGSGEYLLVAGDAKFESKDGKQYIVYEGKRIEVPAGKQAGITGTASAAHAADWDADGDLDLIVGDIRGNLHLVPNEGDAKQFAFGKEQTLRAGDIALRVEGDAGPFAADWDGDGDLDLLSGAGDGSVWLYRNDGTVKAPKLAAGEQLVPRVATGSYEDEAPKAPTRGTRSKICAADYNGDGRLDLLVGDFSRMKPDRPEPTEAERAEHERIRRELSPINQRYSDLMTRLHGGSPPKDQAEREKLEQDAEDVRTRMSALRQKLPVESENHGWVWLFLRKPAETAGAGRP